MDEHSGARGRVRACEGHGRRRRAADLTLGADRVRQGDQVHPATLLGSARPLRCGHRAPARAWIMAVMDWMRDNLKTIVIIAVAAMAVPYLLTLFGVIRF